MLKKTWSEHIKSCWEELDASFDELHFVPMDDVKVFIFCFDNKDFSQFMQKFRD